VNNAEILAQAQHILARREEEQAAELRRLYKKYATQRRSHPHDLGKPKNLTPEEALLLVALERSKFVVSGDCPNNNRWHGDASCQYHARDTAIVMMAASRLELLWGLWRTVSDQNGDTLTLTEEHLQGSIFRRDIQELECELKAEEDTRLESGSS
jgi:hypothetical protein